MPRKVRDLIRDLENYRCYNIRQRWRRREILSGEASKVGHQSNPKSVKATDIYHRWVAWSQEDQCYVGLCPDLFHGGVHGADPIEVARDLQTVIDEWEALFRAEGRELPPALTRPMHEVA